ncbi:MAG: Crp/Fnr family transcriptional regulator [Pseudomonadota bacterium]
MSTIQNYLLALLPAKDRKHLLALCEPVHLQLSKVLCEPGDTTNYVYFPTESFISLVSFVDGHQGVEVGMVGREGLVGAHVALGVAATPLQALVQGAGMAWRIPRPAFMRELGSSVSLQRVLDRYLYILMMQLTTSAACLRYHQVGPRLARWLLMCQDRAQADHFQMTQEVLATMLGVRRVGITTAASQLQREGLITYRRGALTVLDRDGLRAASCSCYETDRHTYQKVLG